MELGRLVRGDLGRQERSQLSKNTQLLLRLHTCGEVELGRWVGGGGGLERGKRGGG